MNESVWSSIEVKDFAESLVDTIHESFLLLDQDKKVIYVSGGFCDFFKVTVDETIGNVLYDIGNRQWDIPEIRKLLDKILQTEKSFKAFEVKHYFPTIGLKIMMLNGRIIKTEGNPEKDFKGRSLQDVGLIDELEFQNVLSNLKIFGFVFFDDRHT